MKGMMDVKRSIIAITALLTVMAAMTGIAGATAAGIAVAEPEITVVKDATGAQHVTVTAPGGATSLTITGVQFNGDGTPFTLSDKFTVKIDGVETTTVSGSFPDPKTWEVTFANNKNAQNGDYTIEYDATYVGGPPLRLTKHVKAQSDIIAIPEFPAIATPVAAVIGLVFFFQHRKRKEE